jgi:ABC-2 type transport system ATP-binding protein
MWDYRIKNVSVSFGDRSVLANAHLDMNRGDIVGLEGVNGAGKTTLLNAMAGLLRTEFQVEVNQQEIPVPEFMMKVAYVPDAPLLYDLLTGAENIDFLIHLWEIEDQKLFYRHLDHLLKEFNLDQHLGQSVKKYSLGMKSKLFFAMNMARDSDILLLDEPFASFDLESQKIAIKLIKLRALHQKTTLFSSHVATLFHDLANRIYVLAEGRLYLQEPDWHQDG